MPLMHRERLMAFRSAGVFAALEAGVSAATGLGYSPEGQPVNGLMPAGSSSREGAL